MTAHTHSLDSSCPYDSPLFAVLTVHAGATRFNAPRLPIVLVEELQHLSGANVRQLCQMLHIPQGSFYGLKRQNALLSDAQSLRLLRISSILRRAYIIFAERERVLGWLKQPSWELDEHTPWEMLATDGGLDEVSALLDVLEAGDRSMATV